MSDFLFYLQQGFNHITDLNGVDHIVFIITLCAVFSYKEWRQLFVLVTAFTIGHSITLLLAGFKVILVNTDIVELLIPVTILLTSIYNVTRSKNFSNKKIHLNYILALFFGLIHGMGFSSFFSAMLMGIDGASIVFPLLSFNIGIEVGQMLIVACFLVLLYLGEKIFSLSHHNWNLYLSGAGGGIAVTMILDAVL